MYLLEEILAGVVVALLLVAGRRAHTAIRRWGRTLLAYHRMTNYELARLRAALARSERRMADQLAALRDRDDALDGRLSRHELRSHPG